MGVQACPYRSPECPYYERPPIVPGETIGCYSDQHHIVPQRLGETTLAKTFIELPENKQQICRWEHECVMEQPLPPREEMVASIVSALESGEVYLSKRKKKALNV